MVLAFGRHLPYVLDREDMDALVLAFGRPSTPPLPYFLGQDDTDAIVLAFGRLPTPPLP